MSKKLNAEELSAQYPSLRLAYEQVKDVLSGQEQTSSILDNKISTLFGVSTAIIGIGIPLIISMITTPFRLEIIIPVSLLLLVVISIYIMIVKACFSAYKLKEFITMDDPNEIRKKMWDVDPAIFYHEILFRVYLPLLLPLKQEDQV